MKPAAKYKTDDLQWTLRVSNRSRYARLQVKPFGGLEVVIPRHFPRQQIEPFIQQHRGWIEQKLAEQRLLHQSLRLPETIELALDGSRNKVAIGGAGVNDDAAIIIQGEQLDTQIAEMRHWVRQRAWQLLPPMLEALSEKVGIDYRKVSIRSQKTRWGSCSSTGTISLNDQLLFIPRPSVEYLMIHELCHRRVMNHSPQFWQMVESFCPDYRRHESILDSARRAVPAWFLASLYDR